MRIDESWKDSGTCKMNFERGQVHSVLLIAPMDMIFSPEMAMSTGRLSLMSVTLFRSTLFL